MYSRDLFIHIQQCLGIVSQQVNPKGLAISVVHTDIYLDCCNQGLDRGVSVSKLMSNHTLHYIISTPVMLANS